MAAVWGASAYEGFQLWLELVLVSRARVSSYGLIELIAMSRARASSYG